MVTVQVSPEPDTVAFRFWIDVDHNSLDPKFSPASPDGATRVIIILSLDFAQLVLALLDAIVTDVNVGATKSKA